MIPFPRRPAPHVFLGQMLAVVCLGLATPFFLPRQSGNLALALIVGLVVIPGAIAALMIRRHMRRKRSWAFTWSGSLAAVYICSGLTPLLAKCLSAAASPLTFVSHLGPLVFLLLFGVGFGLLGYALGPRPDFRLRCAKCDYEIGSEVSRGYDRCPECGTLFIEQAQIRRGAGHARRRVMIAGAVLMAVSIAPLLVRGDLSARARALYLRSLSAESLARVAFDTGELSPEAATQLEGRTLSRREEEAAIDAAMDSLERSPVVTESARGWLASMWRDGRFSEAQRKRLFSGRCEVGLVNRSAARVGKPVGMHIAAGYRDSGGAAGSSALIVVSGYSQGDGAEWTGRWEKPGLIVTQGLGMPQGTGPADSVYPGFVAHRAGPMTVRARGWVFITSFTRLDRVEWKEDGTPVAPANTLWSEPFETSVTIEVQP